jgi:hypothetical protein
MTCCSPDNWPAEVADENNVRFIRVRQGTVPKEPGAPSDAPLYARVLRDKLLAADRIYIPALGFGISNRRMNAGAFMSNDQLGAAGVSLMELPEGWNWQ